MNSKIINETLETLKDKCIDKVEENFNLYLLNDLSEAGEVNQLFDSYNWYLYYLECAWDLNALINELLKNKNAQELLLKSIKLKRIIDERLLFFGDKKNDIIEADLGFDSSQNISQVISFTDKINDIELFAEKLFNALIEKKWIKSTFEEFTSNFFNSENQTPIVWIAAQYKLIAWFKYMVDEKYFLLNDKNVSKVIKYHFRINNAQTKLNLQSIKSTYSSEIDNLNSNIFNFIDQLISK